MTIAPPPPSTLHPSLRRRRPSLGLRRQIANRARIVLTTGIDLLRIADVADSIRRFGNRYLDRVFTAREQRESGAESDPERPARLAATFAGKEAAFKSLRIGDQRLDWRAIEIGRTPAGWCEVVLHGDVALAATDAGVRLVDASVTHDGEYASAVAIAQRG